MISEAQVQQFLDDGAVTIDTPLTKAEIAAAAAAIDALLPFEPAKEGQGQRYRYGATCNYDHPALVGLIQHPFFEAVAARVLKADGIRFFQTAILKTYPQPGAEFGFDQHTDIQYSLADWAAVPRRVVCSFFLWLSAVNDQRSPMMLRPGSHWLVARERSGDPQKKDAMPGIEGIKMEDLPAAYAAPQPVTARAGQVTVLTTSAVHGGSTNIDTQPRSVLVMTYMAAGVHIGLPPNQAAAKEAYDQRLREILPPGRAHLVQA